MRLVASMRLAVFLSALATQCFSQASDVTPKIIPPSPEASNLGKFVEVPVSLYTGVPQIGIPIYEIHKGPLKINIDLSYHASGIKVEEMASWVGAGWALNAGGVVTRTVRGKPDDSDLGDGFFRFSRRYNIPSIDQLGEVEKGQVYASLSNGSADAEPDQYFINAGGINIQFTFDWNRQIVQDQIGTKIVPVQDVNSTLNPDKILGWDVTDEHGTIYKFREIETTISDQPGTTGASRNGNFASSWYLSQIVDVNNENSILFSYDSYSLDYWIKPSTRIVHDLQAGPCGFGSIEGDLKSNTSRMIVAGKRISEIRTDDGSIKMSFVPGSDRTDTGLLWTAGATSNFKTLDKVIIKNKFDEEIKTFQLGQDYSIGRLTLRSVTPKCGGTNVSPPYFLDYNGVLPSVLSYGQDHWGYANGKSNSHLVPGALIRTINDVQVFYSPGADRTPNLAFGSAGSLSKMTYPTGGYVEFDYEAHDYGLVQVSQVAEYPVVPTNYSLSMTGPEINGSNNFKTLTFQINANPNSPLNPYIPVTIATSGFTTNGATDGLKPWIKIYDANNTVIDWIKFGVQDPPAVQSNVETRILSPGTYRLETGVRYYDGTSPYDFASVSVSFDQWNTNPSSILYKKNAGGIRIKEIRQFESSSDVNYITRQFNYNLESDPTKSSGVIYQEPKYEYNVTNYCNQGNLANVATLLIRMANNVNMLGTTKGSFIGYREVETVFGKGTNINGKSRSKFTSAYDYNDQIYQALPFRPAASFGYKTGLLLEQTDYSYSGNFNVVKKLTNQYDFYQAPTVKGLVTLFIGYDETFPPYHLKGTYDNLLGNAKPIQSVEATYPSDMTTSSVASITEMEYDASLSFLKKQTRYTSKGDKIVTEFYYPGDYSSPSSAINAMKNTLNMVGVPIETVERQTINNIDYISSGKYSVFDLIGGKLRLVSENKLNTSSLITPSNFNYSFGAANSVADSRYYQQQIHFDQYDARGNILQYTAIDGVAHSFLWAYNSELPIAHVVNTPSDQIAYTSFESDGKGNWNYSGTPVADNTAPTGTNIYNLSSGSIQKTGLNSSTTYWISYRYKTGASVTVAGGTLSSTTTTAGVNGWTTLSQKISGASTVTISGSGSIDELRLYPDQSQMTTYSYLPGIGMTSMTDTNNKSSFYLYDSFGRLNLIKDDKGNVLKKYTYHYKNSTND